MRDYAPPTYGRPRSQRLTSWWWVFLTLGIASAVVGVVLLFNISSAVYTLAVLVALGLLVEGLGELTAVGRYRSGLGTVAGVALVAGGILALAWPQITLWALAVVVGIGLIVSGVVRVGGALEHPDGWQWLMAGGIVSLVVGVLALAWPAATVLVLAVLLGIRLLFFGLVEMAFAVALHSVDRSVV